MEKTPKDKLSKQLIPLILLLMLVILLTVIASNLKPSEAKQKTNIGMEPLPETPPSAVNRRLTKSAQLSDILSTEEQFIFTAIKKYRLGEIDDAENDFRTILVFDPDNQAALSYLGTILFARKDYLQAELLFRRKTNAYPGNPIAHRNLSLTLFHLGKIKEAIEAMKKATDLSPDNTELYIALAKMYAFSGDVRNAERCLQKAQIKGADISPVLKEDIFRPINRERNQNR